MKESMESNKDWKSIEKITAILEKYISPNSKVEHNINLPTLGRDGFRQCDVVITVEEPRKHITIVEVQKRNKPVDINTFGGWINKMDSVGAQQLICVSKKKYPKSIIDEVRLKYGTNKVTLMTLQEFDILDKPEYAKELKFKPSDLCQFKITNIKFLDCKVQTSDKITKEDINIEFKTEEGVFGDINGENLKSLTKCLIDAVSNSLNIPQLYSNGSRNLTINFNVKKEQGVYLHYNAKKLLIINLEIKGLLNLYKLDNIEYHSYRYYQEILDGNLAWFVRGKYEVEDTEIEIDLIFKTNNRFTTQIRRSKNLSNWNAIVSNENI